MTQDLSKSGKILEPRGTPQCRIQGCGGPGARITYLTLTTEDSGKNNKINTLDFLDLLMENFLIRSLDVTHNVLTSWGPRASPATKSDTAVYTNLYTERIMIHERLLRGYSCIGA